MNLKKKIVVLIITLSIVLPLLQVFVLENRLALYIHLKNCEYPSEIENIQIINRLDLFGLIIGIDDHASASFLLDRNHLKNWLLNSSFEIVTFIDDLSGERVFITDKNELPINLLKGDINFSFQFLHLNNERTILKVKTIDGNKMLNIDVRYTPT